MRRNARVDSNHSTVIRALRKIGAQVIDMRSLGSGIPDICVTYKGRTLLMEIKDGSKSPSHRTLTERQIKFHRGWTGEIWIVLGPADAVAKCRMGAAALIGSKKALEFDE